MFHLFTLCPQERGYLHNIINKQFHISIFVFNFIRTINLMKTNSFSNKTNSSFKVILFFNTAPVTMAYKNMEFIYYFIIQQNLCIVDSTDSVVPIYMYAIAIETNNEQ